MDKGFSNSALPISDDLYQKISRFATLKGRPSYRTFHNGIDNPHRSSEKENRK